MCDQLEIRERLGAVITAEDCTLSKPSPQPFTLAAERLGVDPRRCLVFEDSVAGVEAAKAAPQPDPALLYEDIYCDQSPNFFMRGCDMTVSHGVYGTTK